MKDNQLKFKINQRLVTGVKPTGNLHVGNYLGAMLPLNELAESYNKVFVFVADYHSCKEYNKGNIGDFTKDITACYLSLKHSQNFIVYRQSDVYGTVSLSWLLQSVYKYTELQRCHSYKHAVSNDNMENFTATDFTYPMLMAADILGVGADTVTVGPDQIQHLEIAARVAHRFNTIYKCHCFIKPQGHVYSKEPIRGSDGRKMSKSYKNTIPINASEEQTYEIIKSFKTDSSRIDAPKNWTECSIFALVKSIASENDAETLRCSYASGKSWFSIKRQACDIYLASTKEFRKKYSEIRKDESFLEQRLSSDKRVVNDIVNAKLEEAKAAVGISS